MKKIGLIILLFMVLVGIYFFYQRFDNKEPVVKVTQETLKAAEQFKKFALGEVSTYTDLFPITEETPINLPYLSEDVATILSTRSNLSFSAWAVNYSDGVKGHHVEYSSKDSLKSEHALIMQSIVNPENPTSQSFFGEEMTYVVQDRDSLSLFIELKSTGEGTAVDIFSREK